MISLKPLSCPTSYLLAGRYICTTEFAVHTFPSFTCRDNLVSLAVRACAFEAKNSTDNSRYEIGNHDFSFPLFGDKNMLVTSDIFLEDPRVIVKCCVWH